ncbi:MAG: DUF86 domain-containing protein [Pseudohongiellaceae bacterium]
MTDDVITNKAASIERCLERIQQDRCDHDTDLSEDHTRQDAIVLNLLRACESAIDMAMHLVRRERLGVPQSSRDAFDLLAGAGYIDSALAERLKKMVGFRNIAIHNYQQINIDILQSILAERLQDFRLFAAALLTTKGQGG